ncbi:hypothetical protein [Neomicrococcus lactis]|uniref:Acetyl/propionyl-CoA carboxylase alpha subunit n=1 Tax=Neomicrococcus lactis TaxID=732241 RepID=A0A7W8YC61_9MICC|nr:hypothetical protein [Neomicrococcus lactis]MBB5598858.1 acetyl/propionyl-CoA carboxylase alpha subunit [Neomicrococcus lactis]
MEIVSSHLAPEEFAVESVRTKAAFHSEILKIEQLRSGEFSDGFLAKSVQTR